MKSVYVVFEGDAWLSRYSMRVVGVFSTEDKAYKAIIDLVGVSNIAAEKALLYMLETNGQTQGCGDKNYMVENFELDTIND